MEPRENGDAHRLYRAVLLAAGLLVLGLLFQELVTLFVAVMVTLLISIPVAMAADALERRGVPRVIGALVTMIAMVGVVAGIIALLLPTFVDQFEEFVDAVPGIVEDLEQEAADLTGSEPSEIGDEIQERLEGLADDPGQLVGPVTAIGLGLVGFLAFMVLTLVTAFYIAVRPRPLIDGALSLFPPNRRDWARHVAGRIRAAWIGWLKGAGIDMVLNGVMIYAGLSLIGLDYAVVFGVLAGLFTVVPYFGPIAASVPPILLGLAESPEEALLVTVVFIVVQQIEGNLTIPLIMSQTVKLHPAVIAIGIVIVAQLIGFIGLFIAVPLISLAVILVEELWVKPRESQILATPETVQRPTAPLSEPPGTASEPAGPVEGRLLGGTRDRE